MESILIISSLENLLFKNWYNLIVKFLQTCLIHIIIVVAQTVLLQVCLESKSLDGLKKVF